jgi:hypothetical protein
MYLAIVLLLSTVASHSCTADILLSDCLNPACRQASMIEMIY